MADEEKKIKIVVELDDKDAKRARADWERVAGREGAQRIQQMQQSQRLGHKAATLRTREQNATRAHLRSEIRDRSTLNNQLAASTRMSGGGGGAGGRGAGRGGGRGGGGGKGPVGFGGGFSRGTGMHAMQQRLGKKAGGFSAGGLAGYAVGGVVSAIAAGAVAAVTAIVGAVVSQIPATDAAYRNYVKAAVGVLGISKSSSAVKSRAGAGIGLGFTEVESLQQMRGVARATGSIDSLTSAQTYARGMSMDVGEVSEHMGVMTRAGANLKGPQGMKTFERVMSHAVTSGLDKSRAVEHMGAVSQLVQSAQGRTAGAVDIGGISGLLSFLSKSGMPGLQGARGAGVLTSFDSTLRRAGGGGSDATSAFMMRAMGYGTGGNVDYYNATRSAQRGILGKGGAGNLMNIFSQHASEKGTGAFANLELSRMTDLSIDQIEDLRKVIGSGGPDVQKQIESITAASLPLEEQIRDTLKGDILTSLQRSAEHERAQAEMGEQISPILDDMRHTIQTLVQTLWPALVVVMEQMRDALHVIVELLRGAFGGMVDGRIASKAREGLEGEMADLRAQKRGGSLNAEDYTAGMKNIASRAAAARANLVAADPGVLTSLLESMPGMGDLRKNRQDQRNQELERLQALMTDAGVRSEFGTGGLEESSAALTAASAGRARDRARRIGEEDRFNATQRGTAAQSEVIGGILNGPVTNVVVNVPVPENVAAPRATTVPQVRPPR